MPLILEEKEFNRAARRGKISPEDLREELRNISSGDNMVASKIAADFNEIKNILLHINQNVNDATMEKSESGDFDQEKLNKDICNCFTANSRAITNAIARLNDKLVKPQSANVWKFEVQRSEFGRITSLTATKEA